MHTELSRRPVTIQIGLVLGLVTVLAACAPMFSQQALDTSTKLKRDASALIDKATEPYADHETEVDALKGELVKAFEQEHSRPHNKHSTKQWESLMDETKNLLGGFLKRWKEETRLGPEYVKQAKGVIEDAFDEISDLENKKPKP